MRASTIREIRRALKLRQDEFARALMVRESTVYRWETDKRRSIPIDNLRRLVLETLIELLKDGTTLHSPYLHLTTGKLEAASLHNHALDPFQPSLIKEVLHRAWKIDCKRRGIEVRYL